MTVYEFRVLAETVIGIVFSVIFFIAALWMVINVYRQD